MKKFIAGFVVGVVAAIGAAILLTDENDWDLDWDD